MIVQVQKSFEKDIEKITDRKLAEQINQLIIELETITSLTKIHHLKKMKAQGLYYRIRIGNYRIGLKLEKETIVLLRFMHRKEIYNYFP